MSKTKISSEESILKQRDEWFEAFIHQITTDKDFLKMGIASAETESFYNKVIFNSNSIISDMREKSSQHFIRKLIFDYMTELQEAKVAPIQLLVDHNDSQVLVWAVINDDDDATEKGLFKAEAKANAKNYVNGFHITSTILEKCDNVSAPPHYKNILK